MNAPFIIADTGMALVDPRAAFLLRTAARHELYRLGEYTLDEAFAPLVEPFLEIIGEDE